MLILIVGITAIGILAPAPDEDEAKVAVMATPTPRPTPMPEGSPTASEERYFLALAEHTAMIGNSSFTMGELMLEAGENPLMMFDDAWIILVAFEITTINAAADAILGMDSPSSTSEIRDYAWSMA